MAVYGFKDKRTAEALRRMAGTGGKPPKPPRKMGPAMGDSLHGQGWIFKTTSSITARSGTTVGTGTGKPYYINSSDVLTEITKPDGSSYSLTLYNLAEESVANDVWVQCKMVSDRPVVDVEYCV